MRIIFRELRIIEKNAFVNAEKRNTSYNQYKSKFKILNYTHGFYDYTPEKCGKE